MRRLSFRLPLLVTLMLPSLARADGVMAAVHADRWADAAALAAQDPDPVVAKLVTFYRLLAPGQAGLAEIERFIADSPDWPFAGTLARRRDEALAGEPDPAVAGAACDHDEAQSETALQRCAVLRPAEPGFARRAWIALPADAADETRFLATWGGMLDRAAQWQRLLRLPPGGAARQAARLDPADRPRGAALLALRHDDPQAMALVAALPPAEQRDLLLDAARYLRRANRDAEALALWLADGGAAERAAPAAARAAYWDERNILARHRLRDGDAAGAFALAAGAAQTAPEPAADAAFLAGFIALRKLDDPARARPFFARLAAGSKAAITEARAHYWLARAAASEAEAEAEYARAAAWPETFYGQLAALALGDGPAGLNHRIAALHDPAWNPGQALAFAGRELARASAYLVGWGERQRAQAFLLRLSDIVPDAVDRSIAGRLAAGFGMPETAIAVARRAGQQGVVLLDAGWPAPVAVPAGTGVEAALALGIIRQESSFDSATISPVGALGLMQLMPGTAAQVAREIGVATPLPSLTADAALNVRLGAAYLHRLMAQYDACTPLAVAAYNAGPARVAEWLASYGDPRQSGVAMLDWIELIPFGETRNYVQRVIENEVVYRARAGEVRPHPLAPWLH